MADTATLTSEELGPELDRYRVQLTAHCYRMLGSGFEADDAVQETMVRAWRSYENFEGRSQVSTWLHRIATNVCLTMLESRQRRARPIELGPSSPIGEAVLGDARPEAFWLQPVPDGRVVGGQAPLGQGRPGPLEGAVDRGHGGLEQVGHLGGGPAQHLTEDEHGPLPGR